MNEQSGKGLEDSSNMSPEGRCDYLNRGLCPACAEPYVMCADDSERCPCGETVIVSISNMNLADQKALFASVGLEVEIDI